MNVTLNKSSKANSNCIVQGYYSKFFFIAVDNHSDNRFMNLISLNEKVPNRVEIKRTVMNDKEYVQVNFPVTIHNT